MPNIDEIIAEPPKREQTVFFILDTSGSMNFNNSISNLNKAVSETLFFLKEKSENIDYTIKIAIIEYNRGCKWITEKPIAVQDYLYEDLIAHDVSDVGSVLSELNSKMSRTAFFDSPGGQYLPILVFTNDGEASDDYKKALEHLKQNKWFARGLKIAFAIGKCADLKMLSEIVGTKENVFYVEKGEDFTELMIDKMRSLSYHCVCGATGSIKEYSDDNIVVVDSAAEFDDVFWEDSEW